MISLTAYCCVCRNRRVGGVAGQGAGGEPRVGARRRQRRDQVRRDGHAAAADRVAPLRRRPGHAAAGRGGARVRGRRPLPHAHPAAARRQLHVPRAAQQRRRADARAHRAHRARGQGHAAHPVQAARTGRGHALSRRRTAFS